MTHTTADPLPLTEAQAAEPLFVAIARAACAAGQADRIDELWEEWRAARWDAERRSG